MTLTRTRTITTAAVLLLGAAGCHSVGDPKEVRRRTAHLYRAPVDTETADPKPLPDEQAVADRVPADPDLELYLRYGLQNNSQLRASYERWRAALERIPQVSSLPDPVFSFMQFVEEVQTRTGPQERRYRLAQTLPWFGKLELRGDVASGGAEQAWQAVLNGRLELERDISVAFFEYAYLAQSIRITATVLELLKQLEPVVQRRIAGATAGQADLLRLQVEIGRLENDLASLNEVRPALSSRLGAEMNWSSREPLPLPVLSEPELEDPEIGTLLQLAEEHNPSVREVHERIGTSEDALDLAHLEKWPDVTVGVDYIETGDAIAPVPGSGDDPWGISVMFNLPIWRARYAAAEREAERALSAARHDLYDLRATLRSEIEFAAFQLGDAARQVVLYRDVLLPRARESLTVTRAAYRAAKASLLDLIDSERALLEFETAYWRACRDHQQSRARLEALVGGEL